MANLSTVTWDATTVDDPACGVLGNRLSGRGPRYRVPVRVFVFGAARVEDRSGTPVDIGARKPRSIVSALAMTPGRPVYPGLLADLCGPAPAAGGPGALHAYLSGLRKALDPTVARGRRPGCWDDRPRVPPADRWGRSCTGGRLRR